MSNLAGAKFTDEERALLADLEKHPGWKAFRRAAKQLEEDFVRRTATAFLQKNRQPDYGQLQWDRGVLDGIDFVLKTTTLEAVKFRSTEGRE